MQLTFAGGDLTRGYRAAAGGLRRADRRSGAPRPHWQPFLRGARRARSGHPVRCAWSSSTPGCAKPASPTTCSPIRRARRSPGASISCRSILARRGMARAGTRADPARAAVRGHPGRPLRPAAAAGLGRHPAPARVQRSLLSAALPRPAAAGRLHPVLRRRPRARARRPLARHRHAHRDAGRHRLRARQPHGAHQRRRRHLRGLQGACGWRRSSSSCRPRWRAAPIASIRPSRC